MGFVFICLQIEKTGLRIPVLSSSLLAVPPSHQSADLGNALPTGSLGYALLIAGRLLAIVEHGRNLDVAFAEIPVDGAARPRVMDLIYNALRAYGRGDYLLSRLMEKPLSKGEARGLLLVALDQLIRDPGEEHTIVNQAVTAGGCIQRGKYKKLINGVLRNFLRQKDDLQQQFDHAGPIRWLHQRWWSKRVQEAYPAEWEQVLSAGNTHPPMGLRVNARRTSREDYEQYLASAEILFVPGENKAIRLLKPVPVSRLPKFAEGWVSVQDLGAQQTARFLNVSDGLRVLDACAAPGGKTTHVLELADVDMLALEADPVRADRVKENLSRLGLTAKVVAVDCRRTVQWWDGRPFDRILADVPCSASGVVRRHPDAKWLRREADIAKFAATQREILEALWPTLAPGGKMLYCTCSIFPEENSKQIAAFLDRHPDAQPTPLIAEKAELQLLPNAEHDGFYYALLQKHPA